MQPSIRKWFAVRTVLAQVGTALADGEPAWAYRERITLWQADTAEVAVAQAEADAVAFGSDADASYLGSASVFELAGAPEPGCELFATMRTSLLGPNDYLSRFHGDDDEIATPTGRG